MTRLIIIVSVALIALGATNGLGAPKEVFIPPSTYDQMLLDLDEQAVKDAYMNQVRLLFAGWMKDSSDQPRRALVGVEQARQAFIAAMIELDKRKQTLKAMTIK